MRIELSVTLDAAAWQQGQVALLDRRVVICRATASESAEKQC